jgi:hypothetical protein
MVGRTCDFVPIMQFVCGSADSVVGEDATF